MTKSDYQFHRNMPFAPQLGHCSSTNNQWKRKIQPNICDALRNLVPFVQFKNFEKHPWRSITFSKVVGLTLLRFF